MHRFVSSFLLVCSISACQVGGGSGASPPNPLPQIVPGGAIEQDANSPLARAMRSNTQNLLNQEFPEAGIELTDTLSFRSQVVAGTVYHLIFRYRNAAGNTGQVRARLFQDLEGNISLESHDYSP